MAKIHYTTGWGGGWGSGPGFPLQTPPSFGLLGIAKLKYLILTDSTMIEGKVKGTLKRLK